MNEAERRDIRIDLCDMVDPDGGNAGEVIEDLAHDYGVAVNDVQAIWDEVNRL